MYPEQALAIARVTEMQRRQTHPAHHHSVLAEAQRRAAARERRRRALRRTVRFASRFGGNGRPADAA
jgi:hypothetical protein